MRIIKVFVFMLLMFGSMVAIVAPLQNPNWFFFSIPFAIITTAYGKELLEWSGSFMTDHKN